MKKVQLIATLAASALILTLSGCGDTKDEKKSLYPDKPTINVSQLEVINSGSQLIWHLNVKSEHSDAKITVKPWNDTTYFYSSFGKNYSDRVELSCNTDIQGSYADCNKVDEIVCDRVGIGSDYSEYRCDLKIDGAIYPQFQDPMRVPTMSNKPTSEQVLVTVGTLYWHEVNGYEQSDYVYETDTSKMFNVFSGNVGP